MAFAMGIDRVWRPLRRAVREWRDDRAARAAAALAFYAVFSLPPLLLTTTALAGALLGRGAAEGQLVRQIQDVMDPRSAQIVQAIIANASAQSSGFPTTAIGASLLLFGATGAFAQMQDALNLIWKDEPPAGTLRRRVKRRILSFIMVLGTALMLFASLLISAALSAGVGILKDPLPRGSLLQAVEVFASFALVTVAFAAIYKFLPDVEIAWGDVLLGASGASVLFAGGKFLVATYLAHSDLVSVYGAAGSLIVLLVWIYLGALVFLFGAEFTQVYSRMYGSRARQS
jgi:membrane protein